MAIDEGICRYSNNCVVDISSSTGRAERRASERAMAAAGSKGATARGASAASRGPPVLRFSGRGGVAADTTGFGFGHSGLWRFRRCDRGWWWKTALAVGDFKAGTWPAGAGGTDTSVARAAAARSRRHVHVDVLAREGGAGKKTSEVCAM